MFVNVKRTRGKLVVAILGFIRVLCLRPTLSTSHGLLLAMDPTNTMFVILHL